MSWYGRVGSGSSYEGCVERYLKINSLLVERRHHRTLIKALENLRSQLGVESIDEVLRVGRESPRRLLEGLQLMVNQMLAKGLSPKTIRYHLYLLRDFLEFYEIAIPDRRLKIPRKGPHRVDRIPSIAELQKLISGVKSPRLRLLLHLLPLTGLRLNEALSLRVEYIDLENGFIHLPGHVTKSGKPRDIPLFTEIRAELKRFIDGAKLSRGFLFHVKNNPEKKIPRNRFYEVYHDLLTRLELDMKTPDGSAYVLHPHVFRKWVRTQLEGAGVNKLLIDLWMGHNSGVEKTYYLPPPEMIKQEIEKADKVMRIFGAITPLQTEKLQALDEAINVYEKLIEILSRENPRLLRKLLE